MKTSTGLAKFASDFNAWVEDKEVESIAEVKLKAHSRGGLSTLSRALNQFRTKTEVTYDIRGSLQREEFEYEIRYRGGDVGFSKLRGAIMDFNGKEDFDSHTLLIHVRFPDGYPSRNLHQDISENIAKYTTGESFDIEIVPKED